MDCPKCGTWNPDDKRVCWRCQTELPKPVEKKQKRTAVFGLPIWTWAMFALLLLIWIAGQCIGPQLIQR
jgi:predicted nucleic acid-binding Zn ribbon protein